MVIYNNSDSLSPYLRHSLRFCALAWSFTSFYIPSSARVPLCSFGLQVDISPSLSLILLSTPMYGFKEKSTQGRKLSEMFPKLGPTEFVENKSYFKSRYDTASPQSTPKNVKLRNVFDNRGYLASRDNEEMESNNHRDTDKFKIYRKSKYKGTFEYQSVSGKSSSLLTSKQQPTSNAKLNTEVFPDTEQLYNSIENNLTECDKILLKLKSITLNEREPSSPLKKSTPIQWNRQSEREYQPVKKQSPDVNKSSILKSAPIKITQANLQQSYYPEPPTFNFKALSAQSIGIVSPTPQTKLRTLDAQSVDPVIELRRKRIHEIIKSRKDSTDNPLETSLIRMKARGQRMFSKMVRTRERSMDIGKSYLQQQFY